MQADYVIVGAGSAGCVLANRLTEDPSVRVILIEAGGTRLEPADPYPGRLYEDARPQDPDLGVQGRGRRRARDHLSARPGARRLVARSTASSISAANPRITTTGRSSAIAAGRGTTACPISKRPSAGKASTTTCTARTGSCSPRRWTGRRSARRSSRPACSSASNTARTSTTCRPAPATASAGASRPAAAAAAPAPRAPICARR